MYRACAWIVPASWITQEKLDINRSQEQKEKLTHRKNEETNNFTNKLRVQTFQDTATLRTLRSPFNRFETTRRAIESKEE